MKTKNSIILLGTTSSMMFQFRQDFIKLLIQQNWMVYTFVCEYTPDDLIKLEQLGVIPITYTMSRGGLNPFADIRTLFELKRKISEISPQIVFSFFAKPVIYSAIATKFAKTPTSIGMLEGLGYTFTEQPNGQSLKAKIVRYIQVLLYKISLPKLDNLIFLNPDDPKDLLQANNIKVKKWEVLGGIGLDLHKYSYTPAPVTPMNFLFIGRLLKEKGIFEFVEAIKIVKKQYPSITATVIGAIDTQNLGALQQSELDTLIKDNIFHYPGYVENVHEWIQESSVFVLPSYREGVPRSTQEAMAIGRPVITTDVPGCRETVIDGVNGFLVPKWNPETLAEKMIYFIENPDQVNIMGKESHNIATRDFDANKVNRKLCEILGVSIED